MHLPESVLTCIGLLEKSGFHAHVVGGCVRDFCLGAEPHDFDLTTDAVPEEMRSVFKDFRTVDTGIRHGTLTVLVGGEPIEITTWRVDGDYTDHRHPESVRFTKSLAEDLKRRDFTVNAMCYSPAEGLTDLFGGREDLQARLIRAVGDPGLRFEEDALRVLRALRFASVLDFTVEPATAAALREKKGLLQNVSAERIYAEWRKLLTGKAASRILGEFPDVIAQILPEIENPGSVLLPEGERDFPLRFVFLFAGLENPAAAFLSACERLRTETEIKRRGSAVLSRLTDAHALGKAEILRLLSELGRDDTELLLRLRGALGKDPGERELFAGLLTSGIPYRIADLAVNGEDLQARGIRGKEIGQCLKDALSAVMEDRVANEKTALLRYLFPK